MPQNLLVRAVALGCLAAGFAAASSPARAGDEAALLAGVAGDGAQPLSDAEMDGLRGGAGFFGSLTGVFKPGASTYVQIGSTTTQDHQDGNPSSVSTTLSSGGTSVTAQASLGAGGAQNLSVNQSFSNTSTVNTSRSFSFKF